MTPWTVVSCGKCKHLSEDSFYCVKDPAKPVETLRYKWCGKGEKKCTTS